MSAVSKVAAFAQVADQVTPRDGQRFNIAGLPRISDEQHFQRALASGTPLSYIAPRAGRFEFEGEDGMGAINAESVMIRIMAQPGYHPDAADVKEAHRINNTLHCAVRQMHRFHPELYARMAADLPKAFPTMREAILSHG